MAPAVAEREFVSENACISQVDKGRVPNTCKSSQLGKEDDFSNTCDPIAVNAAMTEIWFPG